MYGSTIFVIAYAALAGLSLVPLLTSDKYTSRLSTIVLSRFLLNLRRTALRPTINHSTCNNLFSQSLHSASLPSELCFNPHVLGDFGGSLSFDSDEDIEVAEDPDRVSEQTSEDIDTPWSL